MSGDAHNGCMTTEMISKRLTSFDNKFTNFPGAVFAKARCDNCSDWKVSTKIIIKHCDTI